MTRLDGKSTRFAALATLALLAALVTHTALAQVPDKLNYQGRLTDAASQPVNATVPMVFKLYTVASGGSALYSESQTVTVSNGIFSVAIGSVTPLSLPFDVPYYLGVSVAADPEMTPRQALQSSPYALRSAGVDSTAALPAVQITGTLGTAQIANNAVTQAKLSPLSGAAAGKVLGTDGANLQWQSVGVGTVTSVATGSGLTGGPITAAGTISLAATNLLPTTACAANQVPKWNGSAWACAADANSGGTVTSVATGTGLTGGPITASGTINLASTQLLPAVACAANQIPKWNGSAWACAADSAGPANAYVQNGNAFGALPGGIAVLGTTDNNDMNLVINNSPVMRFQQGGGGGPNVVGGHPNNAAAATFSGQTVGGGGRNGSTCWNPITFDFTRLCANVVNNNFATVGGGIASTAGGDSATVGGGSSNAASGDSSTVGGGFNNVAAATRSTVGGGEANRASSVGATIGGGNGNSATGGYSTVAGGEGNQATASDATVGGGNGNVASGIASTIAGGALNVAGLSQATVGGGSSNQALGVGSTVVGGISNVASGLYSTVIAGFDNTASGQYSVAAGRLANADQNGCFVFASWSTNNPMGCFGWQNVMRFGANHGFSFDFGTQRLDGGGQSWIAFGDTVDILNMINTSSGARLTVGGAWTDSSDRAKKRGFEPVRPIDVLRHVAELPITTWSYIQEPERIRHMGAVAQDFHAAFGLGEDDKHISALDTGGVALAAIQGLYQVVQERDARISDLQSHVAELERERLTQVARIDALEKQAAEIAALKSQVLELAARTESTQHPSAMAAVSKSIFDVRLQ